jgi:hypothetical protein
VNSNNFKSLSYNKHFKMLPKVLNADENTTIEMVNRNNKKILKSKNKNKLLKQDKNKNSNSNRDENKNGDGDGSESDENDEISSTTPIQYDMPKPGPHAKVNN